MKDIRTFLIATVLLVAVVAVQAAQVRGEIEEESDGWVETIDEVIDVAAGGTLMLDVDRGGIEVDSVDRKGVRVIIEKTADVFTESEARRVLQDYKVEITRDGNDVRVTAESKSDRRTRSLYVSVRVVVPSRYSIDVRTGGGGIEVGDLEGNVTAHTSGGGIEVGDRKSTRLNSSH
jgi:FlaG/FlaF family flagellin (archaellin)